MSSTYVREKVTEFIGLNLSDENLIDLTAEFRTMDNLLTEAGITGQTPWLGLQFIGSDEIPVSVASSNNTGKYRETGAIYLHIVERVKLNANVPILSRAETVRNAFRGQRIEDILIESVSPPNFSSGTTINFESGYTSASIILTYERDLNL